MQYRKQHWNFRQWQIYTNLYLYIIERNNASRRSTQTRICYIEASSLSVVRSRETVAKEQDKKKGLSTNNFCRD